MIADRTTVGEARVTGIANVVENVVASAVRSRAAAENSRIAALALLVMKKRFPPRVCA